MATNGTLLQGGDGSLYYLPPEVLEAHRLEGELLAATKQALADQPDAEVEGFVNPSVLIPLVIGPTIGQLIGQSVGQIDRDEPSAANLKKEAATVELDPSASVRPSRRRF
jgi:hypothetical protein